MKFIGSRLEILISVIFIVFFQGIFWPPNSYILDPTMPLDASDPYSSSASAALIGFLAVVCFARREELLPLLRPAWPIFALLAFAFVSAFWADAPFLVVRRATTLAATTLLGLYLLARFDMAQLVSILVKVSAFAAVASFIVMAVAPNLGVQGGVDYPNAWRGAFSSKNTLGMMCAFGTIFAVYALWNGYGSRLIAAAVIPANMVLLHFAQSGTPTVVLLAATYTSLVLMAFRRRSGLGLVCGFVLVLIGLVGFSAIALDWSEVLAALNRDPTLTGRAKIWRIVIVMIERRPWFGYGYAGFWRHDGPEANLVWSSVKWLTPHAHDAWLETGLNLGLVGIAAVTLLWLDAFYRGFRALTAPQALHVVFALTMFVAMIVENVTENEFFRANAFLWVFFVANFAYVGREMVRYRTGTAAPAPARPPVGAIAYPGA
jgi:exopolysaccharide production protein ExoQ